MCSAPCPPGQVQCGGVQVRDDYWGANCCNGTCINNTCNSFLPAPFITLIIQGCEGGVECNGECCTSGQCINNVCAPSNSPTLYMRITHTSRLRQQNCLR